MDRGPGGLQRLPVHRKVSLPARAELEPDEPRHSAEHHASRWHLSERRRTLLRPLRLCQFLSSFLRRRGKRSPQAIRQDGRSAVWLSLALTVYEEKSFKDREGRPCRNMLCILWDYGCSGALILIAMSYSNTWCPRMREGLHRRTVFRGGLTSTSFVASKIRRRLCIHVACIFIMSKIAICLHKCNCHKVYGQLISLATDYIMCPLFQKRQQSDSML